MRGHLHTDAIHAGYILAVVIVGCFALRSLSAAMVKSGIAAPVGKALGAVVPAPSGG